MADRENRDAVALLTDAVALLVDPPKGVVKSVRINVSLPVDVLDEIDRYSQAHGLTRSGFLAKAAKREIAA